jgi:hypothetical protein
MLVSPRKDCVSDGCHPRAMLRGAGNGWNMIRRKKIFLRQDLNASKKNCFSPAQPLSHPEKTVFSRTFMTIG